MRSQVVIALSPIAAGPSLTTTELALTDAPARNLLLASLPVEALARIRPHLECVRLKQGEPLFGPDEPIRHVYFPETAVISLVCRLSDGRSVEVGTAGCEGMVGLTLLFAEEAAAVSAFTQIPGVASRMNGEEFTRLAAAPGPLHRMLLRYAEAFLSQVSQTAACNATHLVEERCARWLLTTHDRVDGDTFPLTQEFLAFMLGVRCAGVSVIMNDFQDTGMVKFNRGEVHVLDRARLEGVACDCYRSVRAHFERLLPRPTALRALPSA